MSLVSSTYLTHNDNLYFSKDELSKILNIYSKGVSRGKWKDYAIYFSNNNASFYIFKHSLASPEYILEKTFERKRKIIFYLLKSNNIIKKFENLDSLIFFLTRKIFKILN